MTISLAFADESIRKAGAHRVSEGAARVLLAYLEELATEIVREAIMLAEYAGRRTIRAEDIRLAYKRVKLT